MGLCFGSKHGRPGGLQSSQGNFSALNFPLANLALPDQNIGMHGYYGYFLFSTTRPSFKSFGFFRSGGAGGSA